MNLTNNIPLSILPTLFSTMNEGVWIGDEYERTIYVNDRFLKMSGYQQHEVLGVEGHNFWDDTTSVLIRKENETKRKKGLSSSYEGKMKRKDGSLIHMNILGSPLPEGGTIGIITDMSDYREKSGSEKLLLSAIRQSLQGIILIREKKITSWNRGAKYILGYRESEVIGKSLSGIFMKEDIKKIYHNLDEDIEVEVLGKRKDGNRLSLILTIVWSKDDPDICIILLRDISHVRKSEEIIGQKHEYLMNTVKEYGIIKRKMEYFQELEKMFYKNTIDMEKIYDFFVYSIVHIAGVGGCGLRICNHETAEISLVAEYGLGALRNGQGTQNYAGSVTEESHHKGRPIRIIDLMNDPRLRSLTMAQVQRFQSTVLYSFSYKGKCLGSIMLFMEDRSDPFDDEFLLHYIELFGLLYGGSLRE